MKNPTVTLHEVERALEAQDRLLEDAHAAMSGLFGHRPMPTLDSDLDGLRDACSVRPTLRITSRRGAGTRC